MVNYLHRIPVSRFDLFLSGPPPPVISKQVFRSLFFGCIDSLSCQDIYIMPFELSDARQRCYFLRQVRKCPVESFGYTVMDMCVHCHKAQGMEGCACHKVLSLSFKCSFQKYAGSENWMRTWGFGHVDLFPKATGLLFQLFHQASAHNYLLVAKHRDKQRFLQGTFVNFAYSYNIHKFSSSLYPIHISYLQKHHEP